MWRAALLAVVLVLAGCKICEEPAADAVSALPEVIIPDPKFEWVRQDCEPRSVAIYCQRHPEIQLRAGKCWVKGSCFHVMGEVTNLSDHKLLWLLMGADLYPYPVVGRDPTWVNNPEGRAEPHCQYIAKQPSTSLAPGRSRKFHCRFFWGGPLRAVEFFPNDYEFAAE